MTQAHDLLNFFRGVGKHDAARRRPQPREPVRFVGEQLVRIAKNARRSDDALEPVDEVDVQHADIYLTACSFGEPALGFPERLLEPLLFSPLALLLFFPRLASSSLRALASASFALLFVSPARFSRPCSSRQPARGFDSGQEAEADRRAARASSGPGVSSVGSAASVRRTVSRTVSVSETPFFCAIAVALANAFSTVVLMHLVGFSRVGVASAQRGAVRGSQFLGCVDQRAVVDASCQ